MRDLPQAIEVLGPQAIEDLGGHRVGDGLRYISGATHAGGGTGNRFVDVYNIRGFGGNFVRNGMRRAGGSSLGRSLPQDLANVERIEVLKGPSSVLYGDFQPSGVVNLVTKQPLGEPRAALEVSFGSHDFTRVTMDLTGPVPGTEAVRYRLNAAYEDSDSFKDFFEREHVFVAPVIAVDLGEDTNLTLEGEYTRDDFLFAEGIPAHGFILPNPNGEFPVSRWVGDPDIEGDVVDAYSFGYRFEHRCTNWLVLRNAFRWERLSRDESSVIPFGLTDDFRTLERDFFFSDDTNDDYLVQTDLVAEFETGPIDHELLVGFSYRDRDFDANSLFDVTTPLDIFDPIYGAATRPEVDLNDLNAEEDALGVYAQNRIAPSSTASSCSLGSAMTAPARTRYSHPGSPTLHR
jgi:iron complex outermembrane receptor protein